MNCRQIMYIGLVWVELTLAATNPYSVPSVLKKTGPVRAETIAIPRLKAGTPYSILFAIHAPGAFSAESQVTVDLSQGPAHLLHKTLHLGDPDLYAMFHVPTDGEAQLRVTVLAKLAASGTYTLEVNHWSGSQRLHKEPNHEWKAANQIALGETVFGSEDDTPYIPRGKRSFQPDLRIGSGSNSMAPGPSWSSFNWT